MLNQMGKIPEKKNLQTFLNLSQTEMVTFFALNNSSSSTAPASNRLVASLVRTLVEVRPEGWERQPIRHVTSLDIFGFCFLSIALPCPSFGKSYVVQLFTT